MGALEPLLGIVDMKKATGLVLVSGEIPALLTAGGRTPLTMPALSPTMMEVLVTDLLSAAQRASLTSAEVLEYTYQSSTYGSFGVRARAADGKLSFTLTKGGGRASPPGPRAPMAAPPIAAPVEPLPDPVMATGLESRAAASPALAALSAPRADVSGELAARFAAVLDQAVGRGASDVLFSAEMPPMLRVDGKLVESHAVLPTTSGEIQAFFEPLIQPERRRAFEQTGSVDFAFVHASAHGGEGVRFRANVFRHGGGVAAALRPITTQVPSLAELHLPASLAQLVELRHGLVLVTGATGSGKSTTLAALLEHVNRTRAAHIVTLEDPIEYAYGRRRAVIHQREVGQHVDSFASGLRAALRENPDVLLLGEMRDADTMRMALTAAQTGHLVLSTLHSGSAALAIERVLDAFPEGAKVHVRQELAATLRYVVAQQLVPAAAGGRLPALEMLTVNHAVAAQIRDGRTHMLATQMELGGDDGMTSMERALADLVRAGRVSRAVALASCENREWLEKLLEDRRR